MKKFWELMEQSVILQAVLTLSIWGAVLYLVLTGREVPEILLSAANLVLGFYFGSKLALARGTPVVIEDRRRNEPPA